MLDFIGSPPWRKMKTYVWAKTSKELDLEGHSSTELVTPSPHYPEQTWLGRVAGHTNGFRAVTEVGFLWSSLWIFQK